MSPVGLPYGYTDIPTTQGFGLTTPPQSGPPIIFTPTPVIAPASGTYATAQTVTITDQISSALIYYAIDATEPITNWTLYTGPLTVSASETVSAMAIAAPNLPSAVASNSYVIEVPAVTPTFQPGSGTYPGPISVAIGCPTVGNTIYYTTNNTTPTTSSPVYSTPIPVSIGQTLQAIATAPGYLQSAVGISAYIIESQCAIPVFSPNGGNYTSAQTITMTCQTAGSAIYYTTDGSTPTYPISGTTQLYTVPITTSGTGTIETVSAIGIAAGYTQSNPQIQTYTITAVMLPALMVGSGANSNRFVDQNGNVKFLKGMDLPGLEASCAQGAQPWYGNPPNWAALAAAGVNDVRIPLNAASILSAAYGYTFYVMNATATQTASATVTEWVSGPVSADRNNNYIAAMDAAAVAAASYGMSLEWDLHWTFPQFTLNLNGVPTPGYAMPLWQAPYQNSATDLLAMQWLIGRYGTQNPNPPPGVNPRLIRFNPYNEPYVDYNVLGPTVYALMLTGGPLTKWTSYNLVGATITVNQAWSTVGNTAMLQAIRGVGATNPVGFSGPGYAHSLTSPGSWIPADTISPAQIYAEQHLYASGKYPYTGGGTPTSPTLSSTSQTTPAPAQGPPYAFDIYMNASQGIPAAHSIAVFSTTADSVHPVGVTQPVTDNAGNTYTKKEIIPGTQGNTNLSQWLGLSISQNIPNAITTQNKAWYMNWNDGTSSGDGDWLGAYALDFATGTFVGSNNYFSDTETGIGENVISISITVTEACDIYALFFNQSNTTYPNPGSKTPTMGSNNASGTSVVNANIWANASNGCGALLIKQTVSGAGTYTLWANNADKAPATGDWFWCMAFGIAGAAAPSGTIYPQTYPDTQTGTASWAGPGLAIINTTKIPVFIGESGGEFGPTATVGEPYVNYLWGFTEANNYAGILGWQGSEYATPTQNGTNYIYSTGTVATTGQGVATLKQLAGIPVACPTPTFAPAAPDTFTGTLSVAISCSVLPAPTAIYYTTDNSTPTTSSTLYTGPITLSASTTLKAIATALGYSTSLIASGTYTLGSGSGVQAPANLYITLMGQSSAGQSTGTTFLAGNYAPKANQLSLAWAPGSGGVAPYRYNIQRTAANSATFTPLVSGVNALEYTDLTANQNTGVVLATVGVQGEQTFPANGYLYQVQTQDSTGATSAWSPSQSAVIYANGNNTGIAGDFQGTGSAYFVVTYNKANASVPGSAGGPFPNNTNGGTTHSNCIYLQAPPGAASPLWLPFWGNMFCYWNAWSSWANYLTFDFYSSSGLPFTLQLAYRVTNPSGNGGDQFITVSGGANRTTILNPPAGVWTRYKLQLHTASHGGLLDDYGPNGSGPAITQYAMYKIVLQINSAVAGQGYGVDNLMLTQS